MREKAERLWNQTYAYLRAQIRTVCPGRNRIAPEEELAQALNVSRATVREAIQLLTREGYITRRHGKGTFVHPSVEKLRHRMDLTTDFMQLLNTGDGAVTCRKLRSGYGPCSPAMRRRFPLPCDTVYEQNWLYCVDDQPMIFCKIAVPDHLLQDSPEGGEPAETLAEWITCHCGLDFAYYATHLGCKADPDANWALDLSADTVIQNWQEVLYDLSDTPVAFCDIFFHPEQVDLSMVLRP